MTGQIAVLSKRGVGLPAGKKRIAGAIRRAFGAARSAAWLTRKCAYYLLPPVLHFALRATARALTPRVLRHEGRTRIKSALNQRLGRNEPPLPLIVLPEPPDPLETGNPDLYKAAYHLGECTPEQISEKIARYQQLVGGRLDRVRLYRELARLQELLGDSVKGSLYRLRAMRLLGNDEFNDLPRIGPALERAGYAAEADAARAMYGPAQKRDEACDRLIREAREHHRRPANLPEGYAIHDDRRGSGNHRVAVVVTLYNAAPKLPAFLQALQFQSLNRRGQMELILVDSASPSDEYTAFRQTELRHPIPTLFVRTTERETIQTAWNRGIGLARAPYLSMLGADESIVPETLELLAGHLDDDAGLDWAQGDILVTEVDRHGSQAADIMTYDRGGYSSEMVYLETCYLGPVGAVHRKSMHDRVGYFDGSYRAAGDTEFKNRVLPFIQVKSVPRMLGLYLNYPEERTTASPRAELEDFRAWYLHRTAAGMRSAFADRPVRDLEQFLVRALRYRKSYCTHFSTDIELADTIVRVLRERSPASQLLALAPGIGRMLHAYRSLDHLPGVGRDEWTCAVREARRTIAAAQREHQATGWVEAPGCDLFNDNRYEQHDMCW